MALSAFGANEALVCGGSTWGATGNAPNSPPFLNIESYRYEGRLVSNGFSGSSGTMSVLNLGGRGAVAYISATSTLYFYLAESEGASFQLTGSQIPSGDFMFRVQRNTSTQQLSLEIWTGGNPLGYTLYTLPQYNGALVSFAGQDYVCGPNGYNGSTATVDYIRLYNSALPIGSAPPAPISSTTIPAPLLDYEFTGNLNDTSGNAITLTGSSPTYTNTIPTYNPYSAVVTPQVLAAGSGAANWSISAALSFSWVGTGALTYAWTLGTCANSPTLSGTTTATLTVTGSTTVFGECDFDLTVTDESSNTGTAVAQVGGIYVNSVGVVNVTTEASANVAQAIGPLIGWGYNIWPYADQNNFTQANLYAPLLANSTFAGTVPSISQSGTSGTTQYDYVVVAVGSSGNPIAVSQPGITTGGNATLTSGNYNVIPMPSLSSASYCGVYRIVSKGSPSGTGWIGTGTCGTNFSDTGLTAGNDPWSSTAPATNPYPDWETALPGTITISGTTVTGSGTNFIRDLCAGGSSSTGQDVLVVWSTASKQPTAVAQLWPINSSWTCGSTTSLTLSNSYGGPTPNGTYSIMRNYGAWINQSTNYNYYDVVLAFYSTYFRTGLTQYLRAASNLADYWIEMPYIDYYRSSGGNVLAGRIKALAGLTIRYLLNSSANYLAGIQNAAAYWVTTYPTLPTQTMQNCMPRPSGGGACPSSNSVFPYDTRDLLGYPVWQVALAALYDTNSTNVTADKAWLSSNISTELSIQTDLNLNWAANKMWPMLSSGMCATGWPIPGGGTYAGTVTLTNGSATVTGSGTNWSSSNCFGVHGNEQILVSFDNDTTPYCPVYVSSTQITLKDAATCITTTNYGGVSRSGAYWMMNVANTNASLFGNGDGDGGPGAGMAVFMDGILMSGWYYAYLATGNSTVNQFLSDSAGWLENYGERPSTGGVYYGRISPCCEYNGGPEGKPGCGDDNSSGSRFLALEDLGGYGFATSRHGSFQTDLEQLYAHVFGKLGGPLTDGGYATELDSPSLAKWKDFGFAYGVGAAARIPAILASLSGNVGSSLSPGVSAGIVH
jgi:hypothetical protein